MFPYLSLSSTSPWSQQVQRVIEPVTGHWTNRKDGSKPICPKNTTLGLQQLLGIQWHGREVEQEMSTLRNAIVVQSVLL